MFEPKFAVMVLLTFMNVLVPLIFIGVSFVKVPVLLKLKV